MGVVSTRDFAFFQDFGYRGLYDGETARDIRSRKGLSKGQHILDWMGPDELAANLFRASLTEQRLRNEPISSKDEANKTHHDVGAAVRKVIIEQGGTPPDSSRRRMCASKRSSAESSGASKPSASPRSFQKRAAMRIANRLRLTQDWRLSQIAARMLSRAGGCVNQIA